MDYQTMRKVAREKLGSACRVCPVCNGVVCVGQIPGMGGIGTGTAFQNNVQALAELKLNLRTVHAVQEPKLSRRFFGVDMATPIFGAPIGGMKLNLNDAISEADYTEAVVSGCRKAGAIGMTGDGPNPDIFNFGLQAVSKEKGYGIPVIKPRQAEEVVALAARAAEAGAVAFGMDIDAAAFINMTRMGQWVGPKTVEDLKYIKEHTSIPFIVKGIMTADEARLCAEAGVDGIVVSNHGGRSMDYTPGTSEVLPYIAEAVGGSLTILVDGGIRTGVDILKVLALGADGVLVGRPVAIGAVGGGVDGVAAVISRLAEELTAAMVMTGTADVEDVSPEILW